MEKGSLAEQTQFDFLFYFIYIKRKRNDVTFSELYLDSFKGQSFS